MPRRKKLIPIGSFARDPIVKKGFLISLALTAIATFTLLITYNKLPPVTPLFYSTVRGPGQLAAKHFLYLLPFASTLFFISHLWLAKINNHSDRMFARVLSVTSTLVSFLFTIALLHIIIIIL